MRSKAASALGRVSRVIPLFPHAPEGQPQGDQGEVLASPLPPSLHLRDGAEVEAAHDEADPRAGARREDAASAPLLEVERESVHARAPMLSLSMLDLPSVADKARERIGGFATVHGGSFLDPLPSGADMMSLVRIIHDHDDDIVVKLLRNIRAALRPRGRLLIAEPMADTPSARAMGHGYFGMYLLAMGSGRPRTAPELHEMLREAGFSASKERRTRTPLTCRVIVAKT